MSITRYRKSTELYSRLRTGPSIVENQRYLDLIAEWNRRQQGVIETSRKTYEWAIENGINKERDRAVLPEGLTKTRVIHEWYVAFLGSLHRTEECEWNSKGTYGSCKEMCI